MVEGNPLNIAVIAGQKAFTLIGEGDKLRPCVGPVAVLNVRLYRYQISIPSVEA